jgi:hypothetical protein
MVMMNELYLSTRLVSSEANASFAIDIEMFRHAPAFAISPNEQDASPRDAFLQGAGNFSVALRALDGHNAVGDVQFGMNERDDSILGHNLRVGLELFNPFSIVLSYICSRLHCNGVPVCPTLISGVRTSHF